MSRNVVFSYLDTVQAAAPQDAHLFLLIRHSLREEIPQRQRGNEVPLTTKGVEFARRFGERIRRPIVRLLSSPIARCVDTGRAILSGHGSYASTIETELLTEPGAFVSSMELAGNLLYEERGLEMVNILLANRQPPPGLRGLMEGIGLLLSFLRNFEGRSGELTLVITHDTVLAPFVYGLLGRRSIGAGDRPRYLESCGLWTEGKQLCLMWRSETMRVPLSPALTG